MDNLFSIPLMRVRIAPSPEEYAELRTMLMAMFDDVDRGAWALESGFSTGPITQDLHRYAPMHWLIRRQLPWVKEYWDALGYRSAANVGPASSWANLHEQGDYTGLHSHCGGAHQHHISTVYYLDKALGSSSIEFEDPLHLVKSMAPYHHYDDHSAYEAYPAEQFDFILFPSWLRHRTQKHTGPGARLAISVNYTGYWDLA